MAESNNGTNVGRVEQVTGVVVDAVFPDKLTGMYSAVKIEMAGDGDSEATELVCEVQQHLGDDRVRTVAMDATDGLRRGDKVRDTGGFFFQAEDGIRDHCVTGVQTCALPI